MPARHLAALAAAAATIALSVGWPARAEDSGFWDTIRAMSRGNAAYAPSPPQWSPPAPVRRAPRVQRAARPKPQVAQAPERVLTPPDPTQRANPLATLLSDPTLRRGDIVMFPDGPRIFRGDPGKRHVVADFVAPSRSKDVSKSLRKVLAGLPVGENNAWSSDTAAAGGRLAQGTPDVETTGTVPAKSRSRR